MECHTPVSLLDLPATVSDFFGQELPRRARRCRVSHRHRPTRTEPFLPSTMLPKLFQERTWSVAEGGNTAILLDLRRNFSIVKPIPRNWSIPVKVMSMRPYVLKYTVCFSTFAIRRKSATEPLKIRPH